MIRTNRYAMFALATAVLMSATHNATAGGTAKPETKTAEQIEAEKAEAQAKAKAEKEAAAAEKKAAAEKAKAEKAEAKAKADAEKKAAKELADKTKAEEKAAAAEAKRLAAEQKAKDREQAATAKVKVQLVSQRGITQPKEGTKTRQVWDIANALSAAKNGPVAISELMPEAQKAGLNDATIRTQYARWKQFHGVYGQVSKAAAPAPAATETAASTEHAHAHKAA
jgi:chromosome segregation ATPase